MKKSKLHIFWITLPGAWGITESSPAFGLCCEMVAEVANLFLDAVPPQNDVAGLRWDDECGGGTIPIGRMTTGPLPKIPLPGGPSPKIPLPPEGPEPNTPLPVDAFGAWCGTWCFAW